MIKKSTQLFVVSTRVATGALFLFTIMPVFASSSCDDLKSCERKICEIEGQLEIALEESNEHRTVGLRKALKEVEENCTDKGYRNDLIVEIEEAKEDLVEYEADLKSAEDSGKTDKIEKYQRKIEEENGKIEYLENELSRLAQVN